MRLCARRLLSWAGSRLVVRMERNSSSSNSRASGHGDGDGRLQLATGGSGASTSCYSLCIRVLTLGPASSILFCCVRALLLCTVSLVNVSIQTSACGHTFDTTRSPSHEVHKTIMDDAQRSVALASCASLYE